MDCFFKHHTNVYDIILYIRVERNIYIISKNIFDIYNKIYNFYHIREVRFS